MARVEGFWTLIRVAAMQQNRTYVSRDRLPVLRGRSVAKYALLHGEGSIRMVVHRKRNGGHPPRTPPPPPAPRPKWALDNWVASNGPRSNVALWKELLTERASPSRDVKWIKVPSHVGTQGNEEADSLAEIGQLLSHSLPTLKRREFAK